MTVLTVEASREGLASSCPSVVNAFIYPDQGDQYAGDTIPSNGTSIDLETTSGCVESSRSGSDWIHVSDGSAPTTTRVDFDNNPFGMSRTGHLFVAGQRREFTQEPSAEAPTDFVFHTYEGFAAGSGYADGIASAAQFDAPSDIVQDTAGNFFVSDTRNHVIRKIDPAGNATTWAGKAGVSGYRDGVAADALFAAPRGLAIDSSDNLFVADGDPDAIPHEGNYVIRIITPAGLVSTVAGRPGVQGTTDGDRTTATFYSPAGLTIDDEGNLYVAEPIASTIRKVTPEGQVSTFGRPFEVGDNDGPPANVRFVNPTDLDVDAAGNVYIADVNLCNFRKIAPDGTTTTIIRTPDVCAGWTNSDSLSAVAVDRSSGLIYVAGLGKIFALDSSFSSTVATTSFSGDYFRHVRGISVRAGVLTFASDGVIARSSPGSTKAVWLAGTDIADSPAFVPFVGHISVSTAGETVFGFGGQLVTFAPDGTRSVRTLGGGSIGGVAFEDGGSIIVAYWGGAQILKVTPTTTTTIAGTETPHRGFADGVGPDARFQYPADIAKSPDGSFWIVDNGDARTVRRMSSDFRISTIAGVGGQFGWIDACGEAARLGALRAISVDSSGCAYVISGNAIRRVTPKGEVTTFAGDQYAPGASDGPGIFARFNVPNDLAIDADGILYVADTGNRVIRRISRNGVVTTIGGIADHSGAHDASGGYARLTAPVSVDVRGKVLYVADAGRLLQAEIPHLAHDINGDGYLSVADLIYLVNFLFGDGPEPMNSADLNGDAATNIADVFYLINYLFTGGPAPA